MYRYIKRGLDVILSIVLIILLSPVMMIIALLVKTDGGPAIFVQERSGKKGKLFHLYKFRSMTPNNNVRNFKKEDEITKIGKVIRKTSLDELPQLFNILKGEMSFIGPRPWIPEYSENFTKEQFRRLDVLPGITGLAQCKGRNNIGIKEKINYDIKYVDNLSFKMDLYIFFKSIISVIKKDGAISSKLSIKNEIDELKMQSNDNVKGVYI